MNVMRSLTCRCTEVALLGVGVNLGVLVAAPLLRPDLDLLEKSLSYYAVGPWGVVQAAAFVAFGVSAMALGTALLNQLPNLVSSRGTRDLVARPRSPAEPEMPRRNKLGIAQSAHHAPRTRAASAWFVLSALLLAVSGMASLGLVVYPMGSPGPATMLGDAHQTAGTIAGVAQLAAALAFSLGARVDANWSGLFVPAITLFVVALAGALLSQVAIWWPSLGIPMGATMRLLAIPLVALWGLVAWRLRGSRGRCVSRSAAAR